MNIFEPVVLSLQVASIATCLTFVAGLGLARLFTRRRVPLAHFWEALLLMPMVFPPTVTGYLLLLFFGANGPGGAFLELFGVRVVFTWVAAVIAAAVVSLPLMYQSCKAALLSVDAQYAAVARTLGVSERRIFWRVTFPLAAPGIIAGVALSFARALGEFGATLLLAGNIPGRTETIPLAIYGAVEGGHTREANILLGITVALSFAVVFLVGWCERRDRRLRGNRHAGSVAPP